MFVDRREFDILLSLIIELLKTLSLIIEFFFLTVKVYSELSWRPVRYLVTKSLVYKSCEGGQEIRDHKPVSNHLHLIYVVSIDVKENIFHIYKTKTFWRNFIGWEFRKFEKIQVTQLMNFQRMLNKIGINFKIENIFRFIFNTKVYVIIVFLLHFDHLIIIQTMMMIVVDCKFTYELRSVSTFVTLLE